MLAVSLIIGGCFMAADVGRGRDVTTWVVPVDWKRFTASQPPCEDTLACARMLLNNVRYNLAWVANVYKESPEGDRYLITDMRENGIRMPSSAAFGVATAIRTRIYDEKACGASLQEARSRTCKLIKGVAATHKINGDPNKGWGDGWQSALWAALVGHAGWLMWEDLDQPTRQMLGAAVEFEADRFIKPGYQVPYWSGKGGDTKAEENAWNAMVIQAAVAMMPRHPHVPAWKRIGSELMVSAFALKADREANTTVLDGKPVKDWLAGYNLRDDAALMNHNIVHCDYMACFALNLRAFITQSLTGQSVPETADFNAARVYRTFITHEWSSPPYKPPGGTIYVPGRSEVYYPMGTDWSPYRFDLFYWGDVYAHLLHWDTDWPQHARDWMRLRARRILDMQSRHPDGRLFAKGEFDTYVGAEQMACWILADAFWMHWLNDRGAISRRADWNVRAAP